MSFTKSELRTILKNAGVENITSELLGEICDLHIETQTAVVNDAVAKVDVKKSDAYKDLETKYQELAKNSNQQIDVKTSEEYKVLQAEFDAFKNDVDNKAKVEKIIAHKKAELEKLGLKGSVLDLIVKDDFDFEIDDKGVFKDDSTKKYLDTIKNKYADLVPKDKGTKTPDPKNPGGNENDAVTKEAFDKMGYKQRVELKASNPELFATLNEN